MSTEVDTARLKLEADEVTARLADARPDLIAQASDTPPDYINGDDGYPWLTCGVCEEPLMIAEAGATLVEMNTTAANHHATEQRSQS